jgi:hypothetical protein
MHTFVSVHCAMTAHHSTLQPQFASSQCMVVEMQEQAGVVYAYLQSIKTALGLDLMLTQHLLIHLIATCFPTEHVGFDQVRVPVMAVGKVCGHEGGDQQAKNVVLSLYFTCRWNRKKLLAPAHNTSACSNPTAELDPLWTLKQAQESRCSPPAPSSLLPSQAVNSGPRQHLSGQQGQ